MKKLDLVRYELDGAVARIELDDPGTRNALTSRLLDQLIARLEEARDDAEVRVVVLSSSHPDIFSSGGDLKAFADERSPAEKYDGLARFPRLYELLGAIPKPVICAASGDVLAGAFGIALACDLVVARRGVRFGCPEIKVGVFPFMISALMLRNLPRLVANQLMMTGELISADEARNLNIVNSVVDRDDFDSEVSRWARDLATRSPLLMGMGKRALDATRDRPLSDAFSYLQGQLAIAFTTEDMREGVSAFVDRREPRWRRR